MAYFTYTTNYLRYIKNKNYLQNVSYFVSIYEYNFFKCDFSHCQCLSALIVFFYCEYSFHISYDKKTSFQFIAY